MVHRIVIATALLLTFFCGCGKFKSHDQPAKLPPALGTKPPVDPRDVEIPGFQLSGPRASQIKTQTVMLADGAIYEGGVSADGQPFGQGRILGQNGTDQRGEWRHGVVYRVAGTWIAPDGTKEVGTWNLDGTRSGGTISWTNGWKYVGDWKVTFSGQPELPHGAGVMTSPDGKVQDGLWHQGTFIDPKP